MAEALDWIHFTGSVAAFLGLDASELRHETHFYNDLGIDSLGLFSLGISLMRTYGIKLPLSVVPGIRTVGDAFELMKTQGQPMR